MIWFASRTLPAMILLAGAPVAAQLPDFDAMPPTTCAEHDERIRMLLLGSYHMSNPGADMFNLEADDVLAPRRQEEITALVNALAAFRPTKVAVEASYGDSAVVARYAAYLRGEQELRRSETEQVGFRLARQAGHDTIYPVDFRMGMDFESLGPIAARSATHAARMQEMQAYGQAAIRQMGEWLSGGTLSEMYYQLNRPEVLRASHWPYVDYLLPFVDGDDYAGAELLAGWYERNLRIFSNLIRIAEPGDRLFVVYGMGHVPILKHLAESSGVFCYEDPLPYLE
jgi:hypothetical protein